MDGADKLLADYRREFRLTALRWWIVTAIIAAVYLFTDMFKREGVMLIAAIAALAFFAVMSVYSTLFVFVIEPMRIKKLLNGLPDDKRAGVLAQYEKAAKLGNRRFLDEYLIFFVNMKMVMPKYSDIRSAELKGRNLLLDIGKEKPLKMPFDFDENPAVLVAVMRSRNPDISVILNGKIVESMENKKKK